MEEEHNKIIDLWNKLEVIIMVYPYATLSDTTEVVHSEMKSDGRVKVYIEKAVYDGFYNATCYLPDYIWENIVGFSKEVIR